MARVLYGLLAGLAGVLSVSLVVNEQSLQLAAAIAAAAAAVLSFATWRWWMPRLTGLRGRGRAGDGWIIAFGAGFVAGRWPDVFWSIAGAVFAGGFLAAAILPWPPEPPADGPADVGAGDIEGPP